jgi:hypothetical protein
MPLASVADLFIRTWAGSSKSSLFRRDFCLHVSFQSYRSAPRGCATIRDRRPRLRRQLLRHGEKGVKNQAYPYSKGRPDCNPPNGGSFRFHLKLINLSSGTTTIVVLPVLRRNRFIRGKVIEKVWICAGVTRHVPFGLTGTATPHFTRRITTLVWKCFTWRLFARNRSANS